MIFLCPSLFPLLLLCVGEQVTHGGFNVDLRSARPVIPISHPHPRAHAHNGSYLAGCRFLMPFLLLGPFPLTRARARVEPPSSGQSSTPSFPSSTLPLSLCPTHTHTSTAQLIPLNHAITAGHSYSICVYRSQPNGKLRASERFHSTRLTAVTAREEERGQRRRRHTRVRDLHLAPPDICQSLSRLCRT